MADDVRNDVAELRPRWLAVLHHGLAAHHLVARFHHGGPVLSILPDARLVTVVATADGTHRRLAVVNLESPAGPQPLSNIGLNEVPQVAATSDGRRLAAGDGAGRVTIVDTDGWEVVSRIDGPPGRVGSVAVSPDGRLVAGLWFRADSRQLVVYEIATGGT